MQKIKIIAMGKLTEPAFRDAAGEYLKRMSRYYQVTVVEPKPENTPQNPSEAEIERALSREAEKIMAEFPPRAYVVAMCVEGKTLSSEALAVLVEKQAAVSSEICFVIGSSHGLHDSVKKRADMRLSVSPMTFPHHLARIMVLEQLYRAEAIQAGSKYHK